MGNWKAIEDNGQYIRIPIRKYAPNPIPLKDRVAKTKAEIVEVCSHIERVTKDFTLDSRDKRIALDRLHRKYARLSWALDR